MKHCRLFALIVALFALTLLFAACDPPQKVYTSVKFVVSETESEILRFKIGSKVQFPEVEKEDCVLEGWYKDEACTEENKCDTENCIATEEGATYYAKFREIATYTVKFVLGENTVDKTFKEGEKVQFPDATKEGYLFEGWYKDEACTEENKCDTENCFATENGVTYYAKYRQLAVYTATFVIGDKTTTASVTEGSSVRFPAATMDGYKFNGWYTDAEFSSESKVASFSYVPTGDVTFYAKFTKIEIRYYTVQELLDICSGLASGVVSTQRYYISARVDAITNANYGAMTISDETGTISVYGTYSADGVSRYPELSDKPYAGDYVVLYANLKNYNGSYEINSGWIISVVHDDTPIDISDYTEMTIKAARGAEEGALVKITGVVAAITYSTGIIPSGFYVVDQTESIFVHDAQIAARVAVGNKVEIAGSKTYWILDSEKNNAEKFGYKGCNQLEKAVLISNDEALNEFDKSWIPESTVKQIMNTPVSVDISTTIFKVNALVKKAENPGFVNYYIDDIDGVTGSYVYTQCNGSDFTWLDAFDGKICTVYLSAINAKSTASGCSWRFLPVSVKYENYTFDLNNATEYALTYHCVDIIANSYTADPALQLVTEVSSELLGFTNVQISYTSSNEDVVYIENGVLHTKNLGKATVTATATLSGYKSATAEIVIEVSESIAIDSVTVKQAIDANVDDVVTVKGIVGPSLVNKTGFYLIDKTGAIAITTDSATLEQLKFGNEVILKGTRAQFNVNGSVVGQLCLLDCELIENYFGTHEYSTESFDSSKTVLELYQMSVEENHTAQVYVVTVRVTKAVSQFSVTYSIEDTEGHYIQLYSGGAKQYEWLDEYVGQTVTMEIALCNWNKKNSYKACVLAVYNEDGTKTYNMLNFS